MTTMTDEHAQGDVADDFPPQQPEPDEAPDEAPYGYLADGVTPRGKPGPKPGSRRGPSSRKSRGSRPGRGRSGSTRPPRSKAKPAAAASSGTTDYTEGLIGLLQLAVTPLALMAIQRPVYAADLATVMVHGDQLCAEVNALAQQYPEVEAVVERMCAAGPFGGILAAGIAIGVQCAANHGLVPPGFMGSVQPGVMVQTFMNMQQANEE